MLYQRDREILERLYFCGYLTTHKRAHEKNRQRDAGPMPLDFDKSMNPHHIVAPIKSLDN